MNKTEKADQINCERTHKHIHGSLRSTKAAALKIKAEIAALLVRSSFLEKKHAIESRQREIKRRLEELELETKIAEVNAKIAMLDASKKYKSAKSKPVKEPKVLTSTYQTNVSSLCPSNQTTSVPVMASNQTGAGSEVDEINWDAPAISFLVRADEHTMAGTETQASQTEAPNIPLPEAPEPQEENIQVSAVDLSHTATSKLDILDRDNSDRPVAKMPVLEHVNTGLEREEGHESDGVVAVDMDSVRRTIIALPTQRFKSTHLIGGPMSSMSFEKCHVAMLICVLFILLTDQTDKLFHLKRYKAFKRKRWKCFI